MRKNNEPMKALSFSIPLVLADKIDDSAQHNRRSFTQEVVWRLEQSYEGFVGKEKLQTELALSLEQSKVNNL